jgi:hypothetical protein
VLLAALVVSGLAGCNPRAILAQSELFDGVRHDLVVECCTCLSQRGTRAPGASCGEAAIGPDGGIEVAEGAEVVADNPDFGADDGDDTVEGDEIHCSCGLDTQSCVSRLEAGGRMTVPGACIDQPNNVWDAPCESACRQVITFDPISAAP